MYQLSKTALYWDWLKEVFLQAVGQTWIPADVQVPLLALGQQNKLCLCFYSLSEKSEIRKLIVLAYFYQKTILEAEQKD